MPQVKKALIYVAEGRRVGGRAAEERSNYFIRRGYKLVALLRHWPHVEEFLARGEADIVVLGADLVDAEPGRSTVNLRDLLGADTVPLWPAPGRGWNADRLRRVVDSDCEIPSGLDPKSIAAARRIALALNERDAG